MKNLTWNKTARAVHYPNVYTQILFAFFSAHFIVTYEEKHSYATLFTTPYYYNALLINALIAYLLIYFVCKATMRLDTCFPWTRSYNKRLQRQIIKGILIPMGLSMILATVYFAGYKINILNTVFFGRYFKLIILMLIVFNAYLFYLWHSAHKQKSTPKRFLVNKETETDLSTLSLQIACIFIEGKNYFAYDFKGQKQVWNSSLIKSINYLPIAEFYMIKRSFIINRAAILNVKIITAKKTKVIMIDPLNLVLEVSQRENVGFKKWYAKTQLNTEGLS